MSKQQDGGKKIFHFKKESLHLACEWADCCEVFPTMRSFLDHLKYHLERQPFDDLMCLWKDCGHSLPSPQEFIIHSNFHAFHTKVKSLGANLLKRKDQAECSLSASSRNIIPELPEKLTCDWAECQESFDCPDTFYHHVDQHVNGSVRTKCLWEGCDVQTTNGYKLRDHLRSHTQEKLVACPTCGGLFSNRTKFLDHVKRQVAVDDQLYQCSHCCKRLASERLLRDHIRNHINHYKCPFCEMTCCSPSNLNNHIKYRHASDRPHSCNYCEYSGKTQADLCKHLETHLSEPQHKCSYDGCSYTCRSGHSLKLHVMKEHKKDDVACYSCHLCKRRFTRGTYLTRHLFKQHAFRWPSGHCRFRYKRGEDGVCELQTIRYESIELTPDLIDQSGLEESAMDETGDEEITIEQANAEFQVIT